MRKPGRPSRVDTGGCEGTSGRPPKHRANLSELAFEFLPGLAAIRRAKHLAKIGAAKQEHRIGRICSHPPHRAVDRPWQLRVLPALAVVPTAPQPSVRTRGPASIRDEYNTLVVGARDDGPCVLRGRRQLEMLRTLAVVTARLGAGLGGNKAAPVRTAGWSAGHREAVNVDG